MTDTFPPAPVSSEGKTIAVISYLTIIGTIVALVMNVEKKDAFGWFHIRQMIGLGLVSLGVWLATGIPYLGWLFIPIGLLLVVFWVIGLIGTIYGEARLVPLLGASFQDWFAGLK